MAPSETDGTKCLKILIGHHGVNVKSRKSIRASMISCHSSAFMTRPGELLHVKKFE
jgi:hypothetical protein